MSERILFLAWQDKVDTGQWFPIGRLDVNRDLSRYRFRYTHGVRRAQEEAYFPALPEFPELDKEYLSPQLFYLFQNRVMKPNRPDFREHIKRLGLPEDSNPDFFQILSVSGGRRATDFYAVFPKIFKNAEGGFATRFFLHGWRDANEAAQNRLSRLESGEELYVALEPNNSVAKVDVQFRTKDDHMIGWAPRYLVSDLAQAIAESPGEYAAKVVRLNPAPAPMKQRVLIELRGNLGEHEPMIGKDFLPLMDKLPPTIDDFIRYVKGPSTPDKEYFTNRMEQIIDWAREFGAVEVYPGAEPVVDLDFFHERLMERYNVPDSRSTEIADVLMLLPGMGVSTK